MRAFLALPVPDDTADALLAVQSGLGRGRRVARENLHLTLVFFEDADPDALGDLDATLSCQVLPAPEIAFDGLGTFGLGAQGLVHARVRPGPALERLHAAVTSAARAAGLDPPRREFRPHITLLRGTQAGTGGIDAGLPGVAGRLDTAGFRAGEMLLLRSDLRPDGARHTPLARYPLSP